MDREGRAVGEGMVLEAEWSEEGTMGEIWGKTIRPKAGAKALKWVCAGCI